MASWCDLHPLTCCHVAIRIVLGSPLSSAGRVPCKMPCGCRAILEKCNFTFSFIFRRNSSVRLYVILSAGTSLSFRFSDDLRVSAAGDSTTIFSGQDTHRFYFL
jgi:hypothetical protein